MTITTSDLDRSAGEMMPDADEIHVRMRYLEMGPEDAALLRHIHPHI